MRRVSIRSALLRKGQDDMRLLLAIAVLCSTACVKMPESYAPPEQRKPVFVQDYGPIRSVVAMNDKDAPSHLIKDVSEKLEGGSWRWCFERPSLLLAAPDRANVSFEADITIVEQTFSKTGPVRIKVLINGRELGNVSYESPGPKQIKIPIPEGWLQKNADHVVVMVPDKLYEAGDRKLSFILTRAGFVQ